MVAMFMMRPFNSDRGDDAAIYGDDVTRNVIRHMNKEL